MATVPYTGVPTVTPESRVGDNYYHPQTSALTFGGGTARGLEQFGEAATKVSSFFGQVAADDAFNNFQDASNKLLRGDPNKTTIGPDGTEQPDLGYMGLRGRSALDARQGVEKQLDDLLRQTREGLISPEMKLDFDRASRRYRSDLGRQIGSHADGQANVWYGEVNKATGTLALNHIAANADNPEQVAIGAADLISARVKQAQLHGGGKDLIDEAISGAKRDALRSQLEAISIKEPARALDILNKNREIAGLSYETMANQFRSRADQQIGIGVGDAALSGAKSKNGYSNPSLPIFAQATTNVQGGYSSPAALARTIKIESGGNPTAGSGSSHQGLGQFDDATARRVGLTDRSDPASSIYATQKLAALNAPILARSLGRQPTDAELYIAHQQGPAGASKLLTNPNVRAGDLVGDAAIKGNGGNPNAPASAFTSMWVQKFSGQGGALVPAAGSMLTLPPQFSGRSPGVERAPDYQEINPPTHHESVKADAYRSILDDPNLTPEQRHYALAHVNQVHTAEQVAEAADAKAQKAANDQAANNYVTRMLTGNVQGIVEEIARDPHLTWETKRSLGDAAVKAAGSDIETAAQAYGPGFWKAYKSVTAPVGDPEKISDPGVLLSRAGQGGDLTLAGVQKLMQTIKEAQRSVDDQSVHQTKASLLTYAKAKLSFEQDTGPIKIRDPKGEALFNAQFIPKFEAAYDQWNKSGKNPWEFLTQENVDKMLTGMRSKAQMNMDRMAAIGQETGERPVTGGKGETVPPAPTGVEPKAWQEAISSRPTAANGKPWPVRNWASYLDALRKNPSEDNLREFSEKYPDIDIRALLGRLGHKEETAR
jgi:hypothetical protein